MSEPPTIVFDIGNVLLRWDPRFLFRKVFRDEGAMEDFLATACSSEWFYELDAGDISPGIPARIAQFPHYAKELSLFDERWLETLAGPIEENVALFRRLKDDGRKVYGITNYPADKFQASRPLYPFLDWFDGIVVSGREGMCKPDRRIFDLFLDRYGFAAQTTLFIDDSAKNIATAKSVGMQTIHFVPGVDLATEFAQRGVLAP
jgi:HAD superfamily hydrolase (TIGR01509 family)